VISRKRGGLSSSEAPGLEGALHGCTYSNLQYVANNLFKEMHRRSIHVLGSWTRSSLSCVNFIPRHR